MPAVVRYAPSRRAQSRWLLHPLVLLALLAVLALSLAGTGAWASARGSDGETRASLTGSGRAAGSFVAPGPTLVTSATPAPLPSGWLQNHQSTPLWAGPGPDATVARELPQWLYLRTIGPANGERLPVEDPGDGVARLPSRGWVAASAVGPAGPPRTDWRLALQAVTQTAPRWHGTAWPQGISAEFAAVVDGTSGQVLYGKNANGRVAPASLTKIATAIVGLEKADINETVSVSVDASTLPDSTVMGLSHGERLTLKTLLYGLMLPSGNDAALAIGRHVGGSEARFVEMMNELVARLELGNTHFANPHGLDAPGHYSSPYDMATLARYGMRYPTFAAVSAARTYEAEGYRLWNINQLLWSYEGADGVKPGFTDDAGRAVVASATRNGHRVFVTLMRSPDLWGDAIGLLNYAFRSFRWD